MYTLVLQNLVAQRYEITADIRIKGKTDITTSYVLAGRNAQNCVSAGIAYSASTTAPALYVTTDDPRAMAVGSGQTLTFLLMASAPMSGDLTLTVWEREGLGVYATTPDLTQVLTVTPGIDNTGTIAWTLPRGLAAGTYLLRFTYGEAVYGISILIY